ncbi:MAG: hypothetical protein ACI85O_002858, partial [Saprospiraceae bacterium]
MLKLVPIAIGNNFLQFLLRRRIIVDTSTDFKYER